MRARFGEPFFNYALIGRAYLVLIAAIFALMALSLPTLAQTQITDIEDERIRIIGAPYVVQTDAGWEFLRFAPELLIVAKPGSHGFNPEKARSTSGVRLEFCTAGDAATLSFDAKKRSQFSVFVNGELQSRQRLSANGELKFGISQAGGAPSHVSVLFPVWESPILTTFTLDGGEGLSECRHQNQRGVFVSLGDSITHGRGQTHSDETWGALAAQQMGLNYYNLAVGGSKANSVLAGEVKAISNIEIVSILWGYNDWNAGKSPDEFTKDVSAAIQTVRAWHPEADIVVISPLPTLRTESKKSGDTYTLEDFREALAAKVEIMVGQGDTSLHMMTETQLLLNDEHLSDIVHLSPEGAKVLASDFAEFSRNNTLIQSENRSMNKR